MFSILKSINPINLSSEKMTNDIMTKYDKELS